MNIQRVSVQCSVMFTSFWIRIKRIQNDVTIFSFNLKLYLLTLALENLYFNTLDREKVQGKSLGCIKSRGGTYATGSHRRGMKEPRVANPWVRGTPPRALTQFEHWVRDGKSIQWSILLSKYLY